MSIVENNTFQEENDNRRIKLVNYISIISLVSDLIFIGYYSIIGFTVLRQPILILSVSLLIYPLPVLLNKFKYHLSAKLLIASYTSIITIFFCLYYWGNAPGIHVYLLIFGVIPIFIWSSKEWYYQLLFFSLNLFAFLFIEFFGGLFPTHLEYPVPFISISRGISILFSFLGASAAILIFHRLAASKEKVMQKQNTEILNQKAELQRLNAELGNKVDELIQQKKASTYTNVVKGKLYSVIAHDLRSPFSSIKGLLEIVVNEFDNLNKRELRKYINSINNTTKTTYNLLENLLDWSRLQINRIIVEPKKVQLSAICHEVYLLYYQAIKNKELNFINDISDDLTVYADKYMLSTTIRNLVSNAIKYTPIKGTIKVYANKLPGNIVRFSVTDTGIGMNSYEIGQLFNVNENFTHPGTENEKGTGLGLLICKEFVEMNGGTLEVESEEDKGSTFSFTIKTT